ncbi:MAG: HypC/HybG/HupF family hydrogenase formation chaperone [Gammaproteobacteria bacterium]|nr:HypC/HybG/HupF family hydrogenase formation chaperone [Gammaproteobacteria bacterium]
MCIGIPMQVVEVHELHAVCNDGSQRVTVDTTLVGQVNTGNWLLVFLGAAREILDESTALAMHDAVEAVSRVMGGNHSVDDLFKDLVDREPQLPPHLKSLVQEQ